MSIEKSVIDAVSNQYDTDNAICQMKIQEAINELREKYNLKDIFIELVRSQIRSCNGPVVISVNVKGVL